MSDNTFNPGDLVGLKSGGPTMTVKHIGNMYDDEIVVCEWFDEKNKLCNGEFAAASLERREAPSKGGVTFARS